MNRAHVDTTHTTTGVSADTPGQPGCVAVRSTGGTLYRTEVSDKHLDAMLSKFSLVNCGQAPSLVLLAQVGRQQYHLCCVDLHAQRLVCMAAGSLLKTDWRQLSMLLAGCQP